MNRRRFHQLLLNTFLANVTTGFLWFALVFWVFLETRSVLVTSFMGGAYMLLVAVVGVPFGTWVDRTRKRQVMLVAQVFTTVAFALALVLFLSTPQEQLLSLSGWQLYAFVGLSLLGAVVESARNIALSTCVTLMIDESERAQANGLVGMVGGLGFAVTSVFSGLAVGRLGITVTLVIAVALTVVSLVHLLFVQIPEPQIVHVDGAPRAIDFAGAFRAIREVPGLTGLVLFACFNNLLGGVFMALLDPYGLTLVSVEVWGVLWGVLSFGFIIGAGWVSRKGLGAQPLRALLLANVGMWLVAMSFTIRESIWLLAAGTLVYLALIPVAEAAEQTVLQKVVPFAKQGRVFGLAQTIEVGAAPITAFVIGPVAEFWLIPYADSDAGRAQLGWLLGEGQARGIALVFLLAGLGGLALTLFAFTTRSYRWLAARYSEPSADDAGPGVQPDSTVTDEQPLDPAEPTAGGDTRPP